MAEKLTPFDRAEVLDSNEAVSVFMEEAFKTEDAGYIAHALSVVARAKDPNLARDLKEIANCYAALPILDDRTDDEILGYDENGLPS